MHTIRKKTVQFLSIIGTSYILKKALSSNETCIFLVSSVRQIHWYMRMYSQNLRLQNDKLGFSNYFEKELDKLIDAFWKF